MTKALEILMQRTRRFAPATKKPPKPSTNLIHLWKRMKIRAWKEYEEAELKAFIEETEAELNAAKHFSECNRCLVELQLSVERYLGTRGPWYLNIENEIAFPDEVFDDEYAPYLKDMPKVKDYNIGSYWSGPSDDTIRFIKDRLAWAQKKLVNDLEAAAKALAILENWNLTCHTLQQEIDDTIERVMELTSTISPLFFGV